MAYLLMFLLLITAIFLIILVLIQRGKGGGLAGAFGGMGGQSAFGTKAGDLFTKITIGVAAFWIILCIITVKVLGAAIRPVLWIRDSAARNRTSRAFPPRRQLKNNLPKRPRPPAKANRRRNRKRNKGRR